MIWMATKLRNLNIAKVDLVDAGANPDARIKIAKDRDGVDAEKSVAKRLIGVIAKAFGLEKSALADTDDAAGLLFGEVTPMLCAFNDSIAGILSGGAIDAVSKSAMMRQSLDEFAAMFDAAVDG
jgi:hypothetical protein